LQLQGGVGGARTGFTVSQTSCVGAGVSFFVTEHVFIRPQFDLHYVPGLTDVFGSNIVPEGTVWLGYSFGSRN
jgi:hypothetical protein